jgi:hypothetical protein
MAFITSANRRRALAVLPLVMLAALPARPLSEARSAAEASTAARLASVLQNPPPLSGAHTIQQRSSGRYLDAHDTPDRDFGVVTRPRQDNATQRWVLRRESGRTYTIQQEHTGRFLDAHDTANRDFRVVTRPQQSNTTQRWLVTHLGGDVYAIQQLNTRRFLDAHETTDRDFTVVTRLQQSGQQSSNTQRWIIK